jgi:hypothetical protein
VALLFTSEIKGIQAIDEQRKLAIPADAAKYDASILPAVPSNRTAAYERFVGDLRIAAELLRKSARAA